MLQRKFDQVVKQHYPNAKDAKDTSIHYLGKMQNEHKLDISKVLTVSYTHLTLPTTSRV